MLHKNRSGITLVEIADDVDENALPISASPITHAISVLTFQQNHVLLVYDLEKKVWELPGGKLEYGETARACIRREVSEETAQDVGYFHFKGVMKYLFPDGSIEYGCLYHSRLDRIVPFAGTREISKITLWNGRDPLAQLAEVDAFIARMGLSSW